MTLFKNRTTTTVMLTVLMLLIPGAAIQTWVFGFGVISNLAIACLSAILMESVILLLRRQNPVVGLKDCTALVTGALLGLALPPDLPLTLIAIGSMSAMLLGKHLYGGTGHNLFNPAMVGYAILIVSFPIEMSSWSTVSNIDAYSMATPLDQYRNRGALTAEEVWQIPLAEYGWQAINMAFLLGGIILLVLRLGRWQAPLAMLGTLLVLSIVFYDGGSSNGLGSPWFHLFSGATMIGAFFIVTEPVSSPATITGQWLFGIGVGVLTFIIRAVGAYPDGIAFAILLMNGAAPLIDQLVLTLQRRQERRLANN